MSVLQGSPGPTERGRSECWEEGQSCGLEGHVDCRGRHWLFPHQRVLSHQVTQS